ncbi:hypothetical protein GCM10009753_69190 [Streptantibioticus ferralitis]
MVPYRAMLDVPHEVVEHVALRLMHLVRTCLGAFCTGPYGTFRLYMDARLGLGPALAVPRSVPRRMLPPDQSRSCDEGLAGLTDPCMSEAAWLTREGSAQDEGSGAGPTGWTVEAVVYARSEGGVAVASGVVSVLV